MTERPIREVLLAYENRVLDASLEQFRHEQMLYALGGGEKPPEPPAYLVER